MSQSSIVAISSIYALISVYGVGLIVVAGLSSLRAIQVQDAPGAFLLPVAVGLIWSALIFTLVMVLQRSGLNPLTIKCLLDGALVVLTIVITRPFAALAQIIRLSCNPFSFVLLVVGALLGVASVSQFPHTFDSGQLLWTQKVLLGEHLPIESMVGYSGLIGFPWIPFQDIPLVTFAAGFKPFLFVIACFTAWHATSNLSLPFPRLTAILYFGLMLLSTFGLMGMIELGKDSIFGILFSIAFMTALCRKDYDLHAVDAAIYFAAAAVMGVISVPYMLVFFGLWLLLVPSFATAWKVCSSMAAVNFPLLPLVVGSMIKKPLPQIYSAFGVVVLVGLALLYVAPRVAVVARAAAAARDLMLRVAPALPLIAFAICGALLPVELRFASWFNADGSAVYANTYPLDGRNDILGVLLAYSPQNLIVACGTVVILLVGVSAFARRRVSVIALATMPLAALAVVLAHIALNLGLLSKFNEWDLTKDVPLWYGGTLFALFAASGISLSIDAVFAKKPVSGPQLRPAFALAAVGVAFVAISAMYVVKRIDVSRYRQTVERTSVGGLIDRDAARVFEASWRHLKGMMFHIDPTLPFVGPYFFSIQMFGTYPTYLNIASLEKTVTCCNPVGFAVTNEYLPLINALASQHRASVTHLASLGSKDEASVVMLTFDGKGRGAVPGDGGVGVAQLGEGAFGGESFQGRSFRWMKKEAELNVTTVGQDSACLSIEPFSFSRDEPVFHVTITGRSSSTLVPIASNGRAPGAAKVLVAIPDGQVRFQLTTDHPVSRFPNDAREIAYGLFQPIAVLPTSDCLGAERVQ